MVDLDRQIRVTQARQGGFSAHVLPAAVKYEPDRPLVIYYPNTAPPLTTISGATVTDLGSPSPYNTAIFQGVNALVAPNTDDFAGPEYLITATNEIFSLGSDPFTFEFWWRVGTSLPTSDGVPYISSFVFAELYGLAPPQGGNITELINLTIGHEGNIFNSFQYIEIDQLDDFGNDSFSADTSPNNSSVTALNHVVIQRHSALAYTMHYKGAVLHSWSINQNYLFANGIGLKFAAISSNVPGTAISQIRLTKGQALYGTGAFTPPTTPFFTP